MPRTTAKSKKTTSSAGARKRTATAGRKPSSARAASSRAPRAAKSTASLDPNRSLYLVVAWIVLIAIFVGVVIKAYVVG